MADFKNSTKYKALREAMTLYMKIKTYLTRGTFYGINQNIHLHVGEDDKLGVLTVYNLSSRTQKVEILIDPIRYNLNVKRLDIYDGLNQKHKTINLTQDSETLCQFELEIPPLSPIIGIFRN